jgi:hypothetical protein
VLGEEHPEFVYALKNIKAFVEAAALSDIEVRGTYERAVRELRYKLSKP